MTFEYRGVGALNYQPCKYGASKTVFRGPRKPMKPGYWVTIGGTETFGKFIEEPYPQVLEQLSGKEVVNLGCVNGGLDVFTNDRTVLNICQGADVVVLQLSGLQNMNNRFYTVHPRRNDRFLAASGHLRALYPRVDFAVINYTGHLLDVLKNTSAENFKIVVSGLQRQWLNRAREFINRLGGRVFLLHLENRDACRPGTSDGHYVLFNKQMLNVLRGSVEGIINVAALPDEISAGHERMLFSQMEEPAALGMLGPVVHQTAALRLLGSIGRPCEKRPAVRQAV